MANLNEEPVSEYFEHLSERIEFYGMQSKSNWMAHNVSRIGVILIAAAIPFATTIDQSGKWVSFLGFSVAALSGIDGFKRFGEKWQTFRMAQVSLQNHIRKFSYSEGLLNEADRKLTNPSYKTIFEDLVRSCDTTIKAESDTFWTIAELGEKKDEKT